MTQTHWHWFIFRIVYFWIICPQVLVKPTRITVTHVNTCWNSVQTDKSDEVNVYYRWQKQ